MFSLSAAHRVRGTDEEVEAQDFSGGRAGTGPLGCPTTLFSGPQESRLPAVPSVQGAQALPLFLTALCRPRLPERALPERVGLLWGCTC